MDSVRFTCVTAKVKITCMYNFKQNKYRYKSEVINSNRRGVVVIILI